jgi:hypothetical protein
MKRSFRTGGFPATATYGPFDYDAVATTSSATTPATAGGMAGATGPSLFTKATT